MISQEMLQERINALTSELSVIENIYEEGENKSFIISDLTWHLNNYKKLLDDNNFQPFDSPAGGATYPLSTYGITYAKMCCTSGTAPVVAKMYPPVQVATLDPVQSSLGGTRCTV